MRLLRLLVLIFLATAGVAVPGAAASAVPSCTGPLVLPVSWSEFLGTFDGALTVTRFSGDPGSLVAVGTLAGRTNSRYGPEQVDQPAAVPVLAVAVNGRTLHLELGPLDPRPPSGVGLHLDRLAVDITPRHLDRAGRAELRRLDAAIRAGAPATDLAGHLNRLLPELADRTAATGPGYRR
jgi:hypothetical protein